jgi:hypothetical protein
MTWDQMRHLEPALNGPIFHNSFWFAILRTSKLTQGHLHALVAYMAIHRHKEKVKI